MTSDELRHYFNTTFGLKGFPETFEVDAEIYGYVCHTIFNHKAALKGTTPKIAFGPNNGIMFKGVELILKG